MFNTIACVIVIYNINYISFLQLIKSNFFFSHLYIIDNSDYQNNNFAPLCNTFKNITYICNNENVGIATALNIGIVNAKKKDYPFVLLLDQDTIIQPNAIYELEKALEQNPLAFIAGAIYKHPNDLYYASTHNTIEESLTTITSGSLLRVSMISKIGLHDEKLFIDYVDFEYTLRANHLGYKVLKVGTAKMEHMLGNFQHIRFIGWSTYITNHSPLRKYYRLRNSFYVWQKYFFYFPQWVILDILRSCKDIFKSLFFENERFKQIQAYFFAIKDFLISNYGKRDSL